MNTVNNTSDTIESEPLISLTYERIRLIAAYCIWISIAIASIISIFNENKLFYARTLVYAILALCVHTIFAIQNAKYLFDLGKNKIEERCMENRSIWYLLAIELPITIEVILKISNSYVYDTIENKIVIIGMIIGSLHFICLGSAALFMFCTIYSFMGYFQFMNYMYD